VVVRGRCSVLGLDRSAQKSILTTEACAGWHNTSGTQCSIDLPKGIADGESFRFRLFRSAAYGKTLTPPAGGATIMPRATCVLRAACCLLLARWRLLKARCPAADGCGLTYTGSEWTLTAVHFSPSGAELETFSVGRVFLEDTRVGLGRIVVLHHRPSTSHHIP
jgi:hypothetical protein